MRLTLYNFSNDIFFEKSSIGAIVFKLQLLLFFTCFNLLAADGEFAPSSVEFAELAHHLKLVDSCHTGSAFDYNLFDQTLTSNASLKAKLEEIEIWAKQEQNAHTILQKRESLSVLTKSAVYDALIDYWFFKSADRMAQVYQSKAYRQYIIKNCLKFSYELAKHMHQEKTWDDFIETNRPKGG